MNILWVKAGGLVPPDTGGKIRSYHILRELAREHSITFFSFHAAESNNAHRELEKVFDRVVCVPLVLPAKRSLAELRNYAASFFSREPYNIAKYCRPQVGRRFVDLLKRGDHDVIVCDFLMAAGVIPWDWPMPKVLFTHNVESMIWRRHYEFARNPFWKALSRREMRRMETAERRYLKAADRVLTVSESDRRFFSSFLESTKLTVIPTGVDVEYFQSSAGNENRNTLVFCGSMDWLPNEDSVLYLVREILPRVRQEFPEVSLCVVGRSPSPRLQSLAAREKNMELTGWVPDIRPFLSRSAVVVVPLRIGGGTRLKIFEAMAMAKPVVSTSMGAEGLPVHPGEDILLADEPSKFAENVCLLLREPSRRKQIGAAARKLVEENYTWAKAAQVFASALEEIVAAHNQKAQVTATTR